jgi:hypothetical protein
MQPVTMYIDSRKTMTLRPGRQVVDLVSMLITTTNAFRSA